MIRVALIEDQRDIRDALTRLISETRGLVCIASFGNAETACDRMVDIDVDVILLDVRLPGRSGIEAIPSFRKSNPRASILMLTVHEDDATVFKALCAGASGYLIKTSEPAKIIASIRDLHAGGAPMSPSIARMVVRSFQKPVQRHLTVREKEILDYLCSGHSYRSIAHALTISKDTVHAHLKNIYRKLEVNSMSEAVLKAIRDRIV
jgi:DNA-binding NarL/FixJ family response regulator